jgi:alcohol dehydrogenase class IV
MNNKIGRIAADALDAAVPETYTSMDQDKLTRFADEFARRIIRECLDQCYNRGMNDELYAGQLKAASYIEQHFGVEE